MLASDSVPFRTLLQPQDHSSYCFCSVCSFALLSWLQSDRLQRLSDHLEHADHGTSAVQQTCSCWYHCPIVIIVDLICGRIRPCIRCFKAAYKSLSALITSCKVGVRFQNHLTSRLTLTLLASFSVVLLFLHKTSNWFAAPSRFCASCACWLVIYCIVLAWWSGCSPYERAHNPCITWAALLTVDSGIVWRCAVKFQC